MFLGEVLLQWCSCKTYQFYKGFPLVTLNNIFFLETFYIHGIFSPDQVHYVPLKMLDLPPLEMLLEKFEAFGRSDTAAKRIVF